MLNKLWPVLIALWIAAIIGNFLIVRILGSLTAQRILGRESELGEIGVGKLADLVVLDGDPLSDIHNIAKVNAVVKGGVLHHGAQLP